MLEVLRSSLAVDKAARNNKGLILVDSELLAENTCISEYMRARMHLIVERSRESEGSTRSPWPSKTHPSLPQEHALGTDRL